MGGKASQSTQQIQIPPEVLARYNSVNATAEKAAQTPFQQYSSDPSAFVAQLNPTQQAGIANTNYYANAAQPAYQTASNMTLAGAQAVNPSDLNAQSINKYMSPYLGTVLQGTAGLLNQQNQQAMAGQTGNAIRQGAFGGDRAGIAAANLSQQNQLANAQTFSGILNQGYNNALQTAGQQQALGLSADQANRQALQAMAAQYGSLGAGAQAAGLQGAQAQLAAGLGAQQTEQAGLTALYNQFLQKQSYPFQTAQFLANIAEGTGALSGSTTTTNQALGGFSDARLKENIKPIGKTFDGQNIYSYNFKGHPQTEIGLMAQEVEKHHPEAVGLAGGYKTVRYDKATDDAADRGHFAAGGAASMGGGVMPEHAGLGFADGGFAGFDPGIYQQMLAAYQQMYAPMQGQSGGLSAKGYVPEATAANVGSLPTPAGLAAPETAMDQASKAVSTGTGIDTLGQDLGLWGGADTPPKEHRDRLQKEFDKLFSHKAAGGVAAGRHGYEEGGAPDEIVVEGAKEKPTPAPTPIPAPVQSKNSAPAPAPVTIKNASSAPTAQAAKNGLDIPQIGNTVGLNSAAALTPLQDNTLQGIGSVLSGIGSIAAASDKRLKENIKPVGKTFDGQTVYSYNYKGDPQTRMGLIAQEVEKHHPEAVSKVNGYRMVDYHKATGLAAHRGHFEEGGATESTDNTAPTGLSIPAQGNTVGLNGAAALDPLQDNTMQGIGSMMQGVGSIAGAFNKKKPTGHAAGGVAGGDSMFPDVDPSIQAGVPDFNLDPEDIIAGGDPQLEALLRHKPEAAAQPDNGFATSSEQFRKEMEARKNAPHSMGLAPASHVMRGSGPRSVRNNNPGNIEDGPLAKSMPGYAGSDGRFAIFNAPQAGRAAQMNLIRSYIHRGYNTPWEIANRWAPGAEKGNNPAAYANSIAKMVGVGIHDAVPMTAIPLVANAQTIVEGGPRALAHFVSDEGTPHFASGGLAGRTGYALGGSDDEDTGDAPVGLGGLFNRNVDNEAPKVAGSPEQPPPAVAKPEDEIVVPAAAPKKLPARKIPAGFGLAPQQNVYEQKPNVVLGGDTANYGHDYYTEPFFKGLKHGSAQSWIPLLTGLGTFATTPTRSMLSGVLAGVGAGAQTYGNLADTRNKLLPVRQAAAAQQANVARQLADNFFRLAPDNEHFTFTKPNGETILVTPGEKQAMLQQMLTGSGQYMPNTPENAPVFRPDTSAPITHAYQSLVNASDDSVEGILAGANSNLTVANYFKQREQAKDEMAAQQKTMQSQWASADDIARAQARFTAAQTNFAAADKAYNDSLRAIADPKLSALNTSISNIGSANLDTFNAAQQRVMAYQPIIPVLDAITKNGITGDRTTTLWSNLASAARGLGVSPDVVGSGQTAAQRQAALSALLQGTGISPTALSVENSAEATRAVVDALSTAVKNAQSQYDSATNSMRPTARPTINRAIRPQPSSQPSAAPAATSRGAAPAVQIQPSGNNRWVVSDVAGAMRDPRIKSGDTLVYRDANGKTMSTRKP